MHVGVRLSTQKIDSAEVDDLRPQEIDYYLNKAVNIFINEQYSSIKNEARDATGHLVNDNLRTVITAQTLTPALYSSYPNCITAALPTNPAFRQYLSGQLKIDDDLINLRYVQPKGIKPYLTTLENEPVYKEFPLFIQNNAVFVIGDSRQTLSASNEILLTYIKEPGFISLPNNADSILPPHTHQTIVDIAVREILQDLNIGVQQ